MKYVVKSAYNVLQDLIFYSNEVFDFWQNNS